MLKETKKFALNLKVLRFFLIPTILISTPFFNNSQNANAGLEFQWDQNTNFKRLKWFQKESKRNFKNTVYFFLRPSDRNTDLLKIDLVIPKTFKTKIVGIIKNLKILRFKVCLFVIFSIKGMEFKG